MLQFQKNQKNILIFFLFYIFLILGFYFNENLNYGAIGDWFHTDLPVIESLSIDFKKTLLNYEEFGHRHSPIYLIFLSMFNKIGISLELIRFFHLHISLLLIFVFYKCLTFKFDKIEKNLLITLSLVLFLSPTFRSLSIWPSSRLIGLIFFTLSIYEFLKYQKFHKQSNIIKNLLYLVLSSYISPNFSLFAFYFFYEYLKTESIKKLFFFVFFCLILSLPAFYYIFILKVNFLSAGTPGISEGETIGLSFNFADKILIISSIIFFHLSPFLFNSSFLKDLKKIEIKNIIFIVLIFCTSLYFFNYVLNFTGGGVFFQISNFLFGNNTFFYIISLISLTVLIYFSNKKFENLLIFLILILSNIQNTIYHKYYDPLILILFFTIINTSLNLKFLRENNIYLVFIFYFIFIFMRVMKNNIII